MFSAIRNMALLATVGIATLAAPAYAAETAGQYLDDAV